MVQADTIIDSVDQVKATVEAQTGHVFKNPLVYHVMLDYGMRYKKIIKVATGINSNRSMILR